MTVLAAIWLAAGAALFLAVRRRVSPSLAVAFAGAQTMGCVLLVATLLSELPSPSGGRPVSEAGADGPLAPAGETVLLGAWKR